MSLISYVNGTYASHINASIHIEDRGYQFADGVYEVLSVFSGRIVDEDKHLKRLTFSLLKLRIEMPMPVKAFKLVCREVIRRNRLENGTLYVQITRGIAARNHPFPPNTSPSLVLTAKSIFNTHNLSPVSGEEVITVNDQRWERCDIKSISLLPNILAKQNAKEADCYEAWMVDHEGFITEGASSNAWIVDTNGTIITRALSNRILGGVTRSTLIDLARMNSMELVEKRFSEEDIFVASEAFLSSTTSYVKGVTKVNKKQIGSGKVGPVTQKLQELYLEYCMGVRYR